jgi:hypothetical protein
VSSSCQSSMPSGIRSAGKNASESFEQAVARDGLQPRENGSVRPDSNETIPNISIDDRPQRIRLWTALL